MKGKIVKAISGFYYIRSQENLWTCRAKGVFRNIGVKPLPGDDVVFEAVQGEEYSGNLTEVLPRKNVLLRPQVSNIDQSMIVFAVKEPDPSFNLLDRFLIDMARQEIPCVIYFNKADLLPEEEVAKIRQMYEAAGYPVIAGSTRDPQTVIAIRELLRGKTTVLAGPSGAGKSSLTNCLYGGDMMEVGELSRKIMRGKQTTRHTELFALDDSTFTLDTPGFTSLYVQGVPAGELRFCYPEFDGPDRECRFHMCSHVNEPPEMCGVKKAVSEGRISRIRYADYCQIYKEIKENEHRY